MRRCPGRCMHRPAERRMRRSEKQRQRLVIHFLESTSKEFLRLTNSPLASVYASRTVGGENRDQGVASLESTFTLTPFERTSTCRPFESTSTFTPTLTS